MIDHMPFEMPHALPIWARRARRLALGVATVLAVTVPALAQNASTEAQSNELGIEEITVTAAKRGAQKLQDVPMAITALTGDTLEDMGIADFSGVAGQIPGLVYQDLGPGDKEYVIRGINSTGAATVGVYYDEAVITARNKQDGGGRQADIKLYDLERVEVLKGPQGTLYGAGSMSGTIRLVSNKPNPTEIEGHVESEISGTHKGGTNYLLNGMLNFPIVEDKLALRAVGWITDNSGFIDQVRLPFQNINTENVEGGRVTVRAWPSENLTLTGSVTIQNTKSNGSSRFTPGNEFFAIPVPGFPNVSGCDLCNVDFTQSPFRGRINIYSGTAEYRSSYGTLLATTNWFERGIDFAFDSTPILFVFGVPVPAVTLQPQHRRVYSNEIRFSSDLPGPIQFVLGGFLSREKKNFAVRVLTVDVNGLPVGNFDTTPAGDALIGADGMFLNGDEGNTFFGRIRNISIDQEAVFGEVSYDILDNLKATFGTRWFTSKITSFETNDKPFAGFPPESGPQFITIGSRDNKVTYKFNISYQATPDRLFYFTAAQGFREGGVNDAGIPQIAKLPREFRPDSLWNYEVGAKTSWFDNRLVVNGAAFLIVWNNIQVEGQDPTGAFTFKRNAGKAEVDGLELEITALPTQGLTMTAGGSWERARLTQDSPAADADPSTPEFDANAGLKGDRIPNVPRWTFNATTQYIWPIAGDLDGLFRVDWSYHGNSANQFRPTSPFFVRLNDYNLVNIRAGITWHDWRLIAFATNLFDVRAQVDAIRAQQDPLAFLTVRPRTAGVNLSKKF